VREWGHRRRRLRVNQENPPMRIYIIGNDGITLCHEPTTTANEGEIAVASNEELHAAHVSGKQLLTLWNALPNVESGEKSATATRSSISCCPQLRCYWSQSRNPT
jgi:sulfite reductase beta subunit-like hemoprotein